MLCLFERYDFITDIKRATNSIKNILYNDNYNYYRCTITAPKEQRNRTRTEQCHRSEKKEKKKKLDAQLLLFDFFENVPSAVQHETISL